VRTEEAYCGWIVRFICSNRMRHPREMGAPEVEALLTLLASQHQVAASTQNQAQAVLLFLYREVLGVELPWMDDIRRAKRPARVPRVLTRDEVRRALGQLQGVHWLVCGPLYVSCLRLLEALRLRVLDLDLSRLESPAVRARAVKTGGRFCRCPWSSLRVPS
jgi:integrase